MSKIGAAIAPSSVGQDRPQAGGQPERVVVAFVCENCSRAGLMPTSGFRRRPTTPDFAWPFPVSEIIVPCAGRLQPEHFLKAFEDGVDAIGVICCEEGNCHHLEGNQRCARRLDYVSGLLDQIGLGANRLMVFYLPGSAKEDMALGAGEIPTVDPAMNRKVAAVSDAFRARLATLTANPMRKGALPDESPYEVDSEDESDE
ncbi:MAG TPA: hydrogenase iron-sulfur subunit [Polyangia bacterium]